MSKKNLPKEAGYYWAASAGKEWLDSIVQIYGDPPFFKVNGYNYSDNKEIDDVSQIHAFGPKIDESEYY